jgi:hypothetical protein
MINPRRKSRIHGLTPDEQQALMRDVSGEMAGKAKVDEVAKVTEPTPPTDGKQKRQRKS